MNKIVHYLGLDVHKGFHRHPGGTDHRPVVSGYQPDSAILLFSPERVKKKLGCRAEDLLAFSRGCG